MNYCFSINKKLIERKWRTFSKINKQSDIAYIDKCTSADNVQSVLYDLIPSKYQVSISDVTSIEIAPIESVEKLL